MQARILVSIITLLMASLSGADSRRDWCELLPRANRHFESSLRYGGSAARPSIWRRTWIWHGDEIDLPQYSNMPDLDRGYLLAVNLYIRESKGGSVSVIIREAVLKTLEKRVLDHPLSEFYAKQLAEFQRRPLYSSGVAEALKSLAEKRHKPSLRCLGHIYRYGVGVEVDRARAWAFYDTYNLVAGIDGIDEFRASISEFMTDLQVLEGQGLARTFRDLYTDAWKVPSMIVIPSGDRVAPGPR